VVYNGEPQSLYASPGKLTSSIQQLASRDNVCIYTVDTFRLSADRIGDVHQLGGVFNIDTGAAHKQINLVVLSQVAKLDNVGFVVPV
jgi:hypothetical protein